MSDVASQIIHERGFMICLALSLVMIVIGSESVPAAYCRSDFLGAQERANKRRKTEGHGDGQAA